MRNFVSHTRSSQRKWAKKKLCSCTGSFFDLVFMILKRRESLTAARKKKKLYLRFKHVAVHFFASSWISKRSLKVHKYFFFYALLHLKAHPHQHYYLKENFYKNMEWWWRRWWRWVEWDGEIWRKKNGKTHWKFNLTFA